MRKLAKGDPKECYYVVTRSRGREEGIETIFEDLRAAMKYVEQAREQESWFTIDMWPAVHTIGSSWCIKGVVKR